MEVLEKKKSMQSIAEIATNICQRMAITEMSDEKASHLAEQDETKRKNLLHQRIINSGIGKRFFDSTFDTYIIRNEENRHIIDSLKEFSYNPYNFAINNVALFGINGIGKTHLCSAVLHNLPLKSDYDIYDPYASTIYVSMRSICVQIRMSRSFTAKENEEALYQRYARSPFLIIDEIGKGDDDKLEKLFLSNVLALRYDNNYAVLLSGNITPEMFKSYLPDDLQSRFRQKGIIYKLSGDDYRPELRGIE